jgi:two-component system nitrogen regulation response regulator GlnG
MPMEAQTRLLRVLQQGEYMTVGGRTPLRADVRIIAATHRELRQLIAQGLFREDLYYRLNVVPVRLPPLRERPDDIEDLASHFLARCEAEGLARKRLTRDALERLRRYRWPGNVRELENLVRRIAAIYVDETVTAELVEHELENGAPPLGESVGIESLESLPLSQFTTRYLERQFAGFAPGLPPVGLYQRTLREVELPLIAAALAATGANQLRAAELLGINRNTLRARIRELGLQVVRSSGTL